MRLHRLLRNRAIGLARRALAPAATWRDARTPSTLPLTDVQRRLELLLAAMFGRPLRVGADAPASSNGRRTTADIVLPSRLAAPDGLDAARERYRLLAIERAMRIVRGSDAVVPSGDRLERDLYLLAEGVSIDRDIVERAPGLAGAVSRLRLAELSARLPVQRVPIAERAMESLLQSALAEEVRREDGSAPRTSSPEDSLAWARARAARLRIESPATAHYAGVRPVGLWGDHMERATPLAGGPQPSIFGDQRTGSATSASPEGRQTEPGAEGDAPAEPTVDGAGEVTSESGAEDPSTVDPTAAFRRAGDERAEAELRSDPTGIRYREWDEYAERFRPDEVTVHARIAAEHDDAWAMELLRAHAPLVRQIRARFAPLRAQRTRLRAQRSGDELDLDACVGALVDMQRGQAPTDRLYRTTKPARRTLAIMLLVDVSGSTSAQVADGRTVLDVERLTLLLASEALEELGDPYAVLAFSGSGRSDVRVHTVKAFGEHDSALVRRRVSALASARNTRLGAALRHATAKLNAQPAERRLLLLLSDGQPNDVGGYQGSYAVGDSRHAVLEARASGVHLFCLTVDREEQEYLPHLFGVNGYRILRSPEQLPSALLHVVTQSLPS
ncbi:MAG TPA: VWA domain-containing protein [Gemmatimonadaceae bacterium]|nr:VWA domain-containing protein [Gemmatimonadaceae bacterium]